MYIEDEYTRKFWLESITEKLEKGEPCFLEKGEFVILKKMTDKVLIKFVRGENRTDYEISSLVSFYAEFLEKEIENVNPIFVYHFAILLSLFSGCQSLDNSEKQIVSTLASRCFSYANYLMNVALNQESIPSLSQQRPDNFPEFDPEAQIELMKNLKNNFFSNETFFNSEMEKVTDSQARDYFTCMKKAYEEGLRYLQIPEYASVLKELKQRTANDPEKKEFFVTGTFDGKNYSRSEIMPGFTKPNGIKSVNPLYGSNEDVVFHSHPDIAPLSLNGREEGDLGHSSRGGKKVFVINSRGEVFYTTPTVAGNCIRTGKCQTGMGQVYLGNIDDFLK